MRGKDKQIVWRTILALNSMEATEGIVPLRNLRATTADETTLRYIDDALRRLEQLQQTR